MGYTVKVGAVVVHCDTAAEAIELTAQLGQREDPVQQRRSFGCVRVETTPAGERISAQWWEGGRRRRKRGFKTRAEADAFLVTLAAAPPPPLPAPCVRCGEGDHTTELCPHDAAALAARRAPPPPPPEAALPTAARAPEPPPPPAAAPSIEGEKQNVTAGTAPQVADIAPEPAPMLAQKPKRHVARSCHKCREPGHYAKTCTNVPPVEDPARAPAAAPPPPPPSRAPDRPPAAERPRRRQYGRRRPDAEVPADLVLPPRAARAGERYRVVENTKDETGASWCGDEVWVVVAACGPQDKHPVQWRLRREGDGAEEVGFPTLHPFLLLEPGHGLGLNGDTWRVGMGPSPMTREEAAA